MTNIKTLKIIILSLAHDMISNTQQMFSARLNAVLFLVGIVNVFYRRQTAVLFSCANAHSRRLRNMLSIYYFKYRQLFN